MFDHGESVNLSGPLARFIYGAAVLELPATIATGVIYLFLDFRAISFDSLDSPFIMIYDNIDSGFLSIIDRSRTHEIQVVMGNVVLYLDSSAALQSGLFGLLGDAPIQTVDTSDVDRLDHFYNTFKTHLEGENETARMMLEVILETEFQDSIRGWLERAEWLLLAASWQRSLNLKPLGSAGTVWNPVLRMTRENLIFPWIVITSMGEAREAAKVPTTSSNHDTMVSTKRRRMKDMD